MSVGLLGREGWGGSQLGKVIVRFLYVGNMSSYISPVHGQVAK